MGCGMFCLNGEVVFIHLKQVNKIGSGTLILVIKCGLLKDYLNWVIDSVNSKFAFSESKNECSRTKNFFPSLPEVNTGTVALKKFASW